MNGPLGRQGNHQHTANIIHTDTELNRQFEGFCNQEFNDSVYDSSTRMSQDDQKALKIMGGTIRKNNGHYEIVLPWKNYPPCLQNNKPVAEHRLKLLKKRLDRDPVTLEKYKQFMNDLLQKGYATAVQNNDCGPLCTHWYLPHHPVYHPQKPDKIRVVLDCSARYRGTSLNGQLLQWPDLTNSLVGVLTRFREEPVAFISDVESMFYQVHVRSSDCDALRFLWWPDGDLDRTLEEFQMNVHLFGGASSPSCASFALRKTAEDYQTEFYPSLLKQFEGTSTLMTA